MVRISSSKVQTSAMPRATLEALKISAGRRCDASGECVVFLSEHLLHTAVV
jgi:hypothetical protein